MAHDNKVVNPSAILPAKLPLNMQGLQVFNVAPPTDSDDAVTLFYLRDTDAIVDTMEFDTETRTLTLNFKSGNSREVVIPGGSGSGSVTAGYGINVSGGEIVSVDTDVIADRAWAAENYGWVQRVGNNFSTTRRDLGFTEYTVVNDNNPSSAYHVRVQRFSDTYRFTLRVEDIIPKAFFQVLRINERLYFVYDYTYANTNRTLMQFSLPHEPMDGSGEVRLDELSSVSIEGANNDLLDELYLAGYGVTKSQDSDSITVTFGVDTEVIADTE